MKAKFAALLCMLLCLCVAGSVTAYAAGSEIESVITFTQQGEPDSAPDSDNNSGGGSVFAGIAIYNMLKRYTGKKTVCVDALAGSIASVIAFADSDMPTIPSNAYLMIHKPWCDCEGNANELRKMADTLEAIEAGIWSIYEEHLAEGVTIEQIKELMEAETWLSGEEAAKYFNVSVGEENTAVAAVQDYTKLYCKNTPKALAGGNPPDDTKDQAAAKEKEIRSKIAALTIKHME